MLRLQERLLVLAFGVALTGSLNRLQAQKPLLSITSPAEGTVVAVPASTGKISVTITVSADPSIQNIAVLTENPLPETQPSSGTNQFTVTIPNTIMLGIYHLTAVGENTAGAVQSVPIAIDVERQDNTPTDLTAGPETIQFQTIAETESIIVSGTFSDGTVLDVTNSSMTSYASSNTNVATVDSSGTVTAVRPGSADIIVRAGLAADPAFTVVDVEVPQPTLTNLAPTSGAAGTFVTISGSAFGDAQGASTVTFGGITSTPTSWSANNIVVPVPTGIPVGSTNVVVSINRSVSTNTLHFNVTAGAPSPDFSLSATPGFQGVAAGFSASFNVSVSALNGFSDNVALSVSGMPTGAAASFNPGSIVGSGTSTLTISTTATAADGKYTLSVQGIDGKLGLTHYAPVALTVNGTR